MAIGEGFLIRMLLVFSPQDLAIEEHERAGSGARGRCCGHGGTRGPVEFANRGNARCALKGLSPEQSNAAAPGLSVRVRQKSLRSTWIKRSETLLNALAEIPARNSNGRFRQAHGHTEPVDRKRSRCRRSVNIGNGRFGITTRA